MLYAVAASTAIAAPARVAKQATTQAGKVKTNAKKLRSSVPKAQLAKLRTSLKVEGKGLRMPALSVKAKKASELRFLSNGITPKQVRKFEKAVASLQRRAPDQVIVFRGQEKLTTKMSAKIMQGSSLGKGLKAYATETAKAKAEADAFIARVGNEAYPTVFDKAAAKHLAGLSGQQIVVMKSQDYSVPFFVSTTRDLSVAFGDFYQAPKVRYVYILSLPKQEYLNVHGLIAKEAKMRNLPKPNNQAEKEIAIPLTATQFVRAVYDIKLDTMTML